MTDPDPIGGGTAAGAGTSEGFFATGFFCTFFAGFALLLDFLADFVFLDFFSPFFFAGADFFVFLVFLDFAAFFRFFAMIDLPIG